MAQIRKPHEPTRTERFLYSVTLSYIHQGLILVVGLIVTPIIMRRVGGEKYGLWLMASQFLGYLTLFDFGVGFLYPKELAKLSGKPRSGGMAYRYGSVASQFASMACFQIPMIIAGCLAIWFLLPGAIQSNLDLCLILFGTYLVTYCFRFFVLMVTGMHDLSFLSLVQLGAWALSTTVTLGLVYYEQSIRSLLIGWAVGEFVAPLVCFVRVIRRYPFLIQKVRVRLDRLPVGKYFQKTKWMTLSQLSQLLTGSSDLIVIGKVGSTTQVAQYAMTGKLFNIGMHLPDRIAQVATPSMFQVISHHKSDYVTKVLAALTHVILVTSGLIATVLLSMNFDFVSFWVGKEWYGGNILTTAYATNLVVYHLSVAMTFACLWLGNERVAVLSTLFTGIANLALAIPLTKFLGTCGPLVANSVARLAIAVPWTAITVNASLGKNRKTIFKLQAPVLIRIALLLLFSFGLSYLPMLSSKIGLVIKSVFSGGLYLWVMKPVILGELLSPYVEPFLKETFLWKLATKKKRKTTEENWLDTRKAS